MVACVCLQAHALDALALACLMKAGPQTSIVLPPCPPVPRAARVGKRKADAQRCAVLHGKWRPCSVPACQHRVVCEHSRRAAWLRHGFDRHARLLQARSSSKPPDCVCGWRTSIHLQYHTLIQGSKREKLAPVAGQEEDEAEARKYTLVTPPGSRFRQARAPKLICSLRLCCNARAHVRVCAP